MNPVKAFTTEKSNLERSQFVWINQNSPHGTLFRGAARNLSYFSYFYIDKNIELASEVNKTTNDKTIDRLFQKK